MHHDRVWLVVRRAIGPCGLLKKLKIRFRMYVTAVSSFVYCFGSLSEFYSVFIALKRWTTVSMSASCQLPMKSIRSLAQLSMCRFAYHSSGSRGFMQLPTPSTIQPQSCSLVQYVICAYFCVCKIYAAEYSKVYCLLIMWHVYKASCIIRFGTSQLIYYNFTVQSNGIIFQ